MRVLYCFILQDSEVIKFEKKIIIIWDFVVVVPNQNQILFQVWKKVEFECLWYQQL